MPDSPVAQYLDSLSASPTTGRSSSALAQRWALRKAAEAVGTTPEALPWGEIDDAMLERIAEVLRERYAPGTVAQCVSAVRRVLDYAGRTRRNSAAGRQRRAAQRPRYGGAHYRLHRYLAAERARLRVQRAAQRPFVSFVRATVARHHGALCADIITLASSGLVPEIPEEIRTTAAMAVAIWREAQLW